MKRINLFLVMCLAIGLLIAFSSCATSAKLSPETIETGEALRVIAGKGYEASRPIEEYSVIVVLNSNLAINITEANAVLQYNRAAIVEPGTYNISWTIDQVKQRDTISQEFKPGVFYYFFMDSDGPFANQQYLSVMELHSDNNAPVRARDGRNYMDIPQAAIINGVKANVEKNNVRPPINL